MIIAAIALSAAQAPTEPPPPPAVAAALGAWSECINDGIDSAEPELTPDRAANAVLAGCESLQRTLMAEHGRWLDSSGMSEAAKRRARRSMDQSVSTLRSQIARGIRMMRED